MRVVLRAVDSHLVESNGVDVWHFRLDGPDNKYCLAPDEIARADRYRLDRVRRQFIAGRTTLRTILSRYLGCLPTEVPLTSAAGGKPILAQTAGVELHFNLTHSGDAGLLAVARRPVGIDLEHVRKVPNADGLVQRFFAEAERKTFASLPEHLKLTAFLRGWTCKEALLKAVGRGLQDLESCVVELDLQHPPRVIQFDPGCWQLVNWEPWPGYLAALAVESSTPLLFEHQLNHDSLKMCHSE